MSDERPASPAADGSSGGAAEGPTAEGPPGGGSPGGGPYGDEHGPGSGEQDGPGPGEQQHGGGAGGPDRLYRGRRPKVVAGVCSGLGRYFDLDPVVFRVPVALLAVVGGLGLVFYGFAWLLIPAEGESENEGRRLLTGRGEGGSLAAVLVALLGCALFLTAFGIRTTPFALLLGCVVVGAAFWSRRRREAQAAGVFGAPVDAATAQAVADAPPEAHAPPAPGAPSSWWREPPTKEGAATGSWHGTGDAAGSAAPEGAPASGPASGAADGGGGHGRRRGSIGGLLTALACAAFLVGAGLHGPSLGFACALAVFGIGMTVSAFAGRVGFGTYAMAFGTAVLLVCSVVLSDAVQVRDHVWAPQSAARVRPEYRATTGKLTLDLSRVSSVPQHGTVRTRAGIGTGRLVVVVPRNVRAVVEGRIDAGDVRAERWSRDAPVTLGGSAGLSQRERFTLKPPGGARPEGTLRVDASARLGEIQVVQAGEDGPYDGGDAASQEAAR